MATNSQLQKLLSVVSDQEKAELTILNNAVVTNARIYREDSTAANKRNWDAAKTGLEDLVEKLTEKYFNTKKPGGETFKNRMAALKELHDRGYSIKKSKLYKDVELGILQMEPDKSILASSLEKYINHPESHLGKPLETSNAGRDQELKELTRRKVTAQIEKEERLAAKYRFELEKEQKQWMPRSDFERELAARAAVLDQAFDTLVRLHADDWVHLVGGRISAAGQLKNRIIEIKNKILTAYVDTTEFQVMFEDE